MKIDAIAGSSGASGYQSNSMRAWRASLDPGTEDQGAQQPPDMTSLMNMLSRFVTQMLAAMTKGSSNTGDDQSNGGAPPVGAPAQRQASRNQNNYVPNQGQGSGQQSTGAPPGYSPAPPVGSPGAPQGVPADDGSNTPTPAPAPTPSPAPASGSSGGADSNSGQTPATGGAAGVTKNAGGVDQAAAVSGVASNSVQTQSTGGANDRTYNITNTTGQQETFVYSTNGNVKAKVTVDPGQTATILGDASDLGVRITPTDANGNANPNEILYEDGAGANGQTARAENPDISEVDGKVDAAGKAVKMTVTLSDGRTAGDGDEIRAYQNPTDDSAAMGLAGDESTTANIVLSE